MASEPILAAVDMAGVRPHRGSIRFGTLSDYWSLTKPEINLLIAITTGAGFWMGTSASTTHFPWASLFHTLVGTLLVASGAAVLNQLIERRFDAQMRRTSRRPIASGRIEPWRALCLGVRLSVIGVAYLVFTTSALAAVLAALTVLSYLFLYTPAKRMTPLCTLIGAVPGAAPPLIGCAAASGRITADAWLLFAIVFLWQFPHFMAIAWMYREDYTRAGYLVLPEGEAKNRFVAGQSLLPALALFVIALLPGIHGESGSMYLAGALFLGSAFLCYSARFAFQRSTGSARQLLLASILYLPALFALLVMDKK
jgi:heme o synthase